MRNSGNTKYWTDFFQDKCLLILSLYGHLFKSPLDLDARIARIPREQRQHISRDEASDEKFKEFIESKMLSNVLLATLFLRCSTGAEHLIASDKIDSDGLVILQVGGKLLAF